MMQDNAWYVKKTVHNLCPSLPICKDARATQNAVTGVPPHALHGLRLPRAHANQREC